MKIIDNTGLPVTAGAYVWTRKPNSAQHRDLPCPVLRPLIILPPPPNKQPKPSLPRSAYHPYTEMSSPGQGKQSLRSRLLPPVFRSRSPSPSPQHITDTKPATTLFTRQTVQLGFIAPPDMPGNQANISTPMPASSIFANQPPFRINSPSGSGPSDGPKPQDNPFSAIGGLPTTIVVPVTQVQPATAPIPASHANHPPSATRAPPGTESTLTTPPFDSSKPQNNPYEAIGGAVPPTPSQMQAAGSVAYEGLKTVLQGLYDCSDIFLPLKTTAGGLLTVIKIIDVCGSICRS